MRLSPWLEQLKSPHRQRVARIPRRPPAVAVWRRVESCEARVLLSTFTVDGFLDTLDASPGDGVATDNEGNVTLRSAVLEANAFAGDDDILLGGGIFFLSLMGRDEQAAGTGDLDILENLTITGESVNTTTVDASGIDRVFEVFPGVTLTLSNLTLRGGDSIGDGVSSPPLDGGGIHVEMGTLNLNNVRLEGNLGQNGGGISNLGGNVTINDSTLVGNQAAGAFMPGSGGGIYQFSGTTTIRTSTIQDGFSTGDGAGVAVANGTVNVENSTIARNVAGNLGGGAGNGGGIDVSTSGTLNLLAATIAYNNAEGDGAGLYARGTVNIGRTILAENNAPGMATEGFINGGMVTSLGHNLIRDNTNFMITPATGDLIGTAGAPINAMLNVLADYGGPTETISLQPGSPAIDAGPMDASPFNSDQRGFPRERDGDFDTFAITDIGAVEDIARSQIFVDDPGTRTIVGGFAGDWRVDVDNGVAGTLDFGDIVTFDPAGMNPIGGLDWDLTAFGSISDATISAQDDPLTDVVIGAGTYNENVILSHAEMRLRGHTGRASDVVIDAGGATFGLEVQEDSIEVADLRITNAMTGVEINPFGREERTNLRNLIIDAVTDDGIHIRNINDVMIEDVTVTAPTKEGLDVDGASSVHVRNSNFSGGGTDGILIANTTIVGLENVDATMNDSRGVAVSNTKTVRLRDVDSTNNMTASTLSNVDVALVDVEPGVAMNGATISASQFDYNMQGPNSTFTTPMLDALFLMTGQGSDAVTLDFSGGPPSPSQHFFVDAGSGTDQLLVSHDANMTVDDFGIEIDGVAQVALRSFENASLTGGASANVLDAGRYAGHVTLSGGGGDDQLISGPGDDILNGDAGRDTLTTSSIVIERRFPEATAFEAIDLNGGDPGVMTILDEAEAGSQPISLGGDTFRFGGQMITGMNALSVHTAGALTFITAPPLGDNVNLSDIEQTGLGEIGVIAPLWDQWLTGVVGLNLPDARVLYRFEDTNLDTVNDRLIVEWSEVYHRDQIDFGGPSLKPGATPVTFQAILELNTTFRDGDITFNYVTLDTNDPALDDGISATVGVRQQGFDQMFPVNQVSFNQANALIGDMQAIRNFSTFSDGNDQLAGGADDDVLEVIFGTDAINGDGGVNTLRIGGFLNPFATTETLTGNSLTSVFSPDMETQVTSQFNFANIATLDLRFGAGDQSLTITDISTLPANVSIDAGGPTASDAVTINGSAGNDLLSVQDGALIGDGQQIQLTGVEHLTLDLSSGGDDEVDVTQAAAGSLRDVNVIGTDGGDRLGITSTMAAQEVRVEQSGVGLREQLGGELIVLETLVNNMMDGVGTTITDQDNPHGIAISPDGQRVYVAARDSNSLVAYNRDTATGQLTFAESLVNGMNDSQANRIDGLMGPTAVAVSNDGGHVYVGSDVSETIAVFRLDEATGRHIFESSMIDELPGQNPLIGIHAMTFSADGMMLLVAAEQSDSLVVLEREPSGRLRFSAAIADGDMIPIEGGGNVTGLDGPSSVAVSPDGQFLYVTGFNDNSIVTFSRGFDEMTPPIFIESLVDGGMDGAMNVIAGLKGATTATVSPDGLQVFVASEISNALAVFNRDVMTGQLTFVEALIDGGMDSGGNNITGLLTPGGVTSSPDGSLVFVGSSGSNAVTIFARDPEAGGSLTFVDSLANGGFDAAGNSVSGLGGAFSVVAPADGRHIYALGETDDAVAAFSRPLTLKVSTGGGAIPITVSTMDSDDFVKVLLDGLPSSDITIDTGAHVGSDSVDVVATAANDTVDVNDETITFAGQSIALLNVENATVNGADGDDTISVSPSANTAFTILGGDPAAPAAGDLLDFSTPVDETATLTHTGSDDGTIAATGGSLPVSFDEIESLGFSDDLIVEGTSNDDLLDVIATDTDTGTLQLTMDVDSSAGEPTLGPKVNIAGLTSLVFNGQADNDRLKISNPGGDVFKPSEGITYDGGTGVDDLEIVGGAATTVTHSLDTQNDGAVSYDGTDFISYSGLEPVADSIAATNRIFQFTSANDETITLSDVGTPSDGQSQIDSTQGEVVFFTNPTSSLTIETSLAGGSGTDTINVEGLDGNWDADLIINGDNDDVVQFQSSTTDTDSGDLTVTGFSITVDEPIVTSADGVVSLSALAGNTSDVQLNSTITTDRGDIMLQAGRHVVVSAAGDIATNQGNVDIRASLAPAFFGGRIDFSGDIAHGTGELRTFSFQNSFLNGVVSGSGIYRKQGDGQMKLESASTHTGVIRIEDGFIIAEDADALGSTAAGTEVISGGTLNLDPLVVTEPLTLNGNGHGSGGQTGALVLNDTTVSSAITLASDSRIRSNGNSVISGAIGETGGARAVTFQAAAGSVLTLSGAGHTYTGTTTLVDPGTLLLTGATPAASAVTISAGSTLSGTGSIRGPLTVSGTLAPGLSPGILNAADVTLADNSTLDIEIGGPMAGNASNNHDQIDASGFVNIGANVTLNTASFNGFIPDAGQRYEIINRTGGTGTFNGLAEGATISTNFLDSGFTATITYAGGDGDDVVIQVGTDLVLDGGAMSDTLLITATDGNSGTRMLNLDGNVGLTVPFSGVTSVTFNGGDGSDVLTIINPNGSVFTPSSGVFFNGQGAGGDVDSLLITGGVASDVDFNYLNLNDGSIDYNGMTAITYTGLEPIESSVSATNVTLNYSDGDDAITVVDSEGNTRVDSTLGEETLFENPTGALTINTGGGNDTVTLDSLGVGWNADLNINGGDVQVTGLVDLDNGNANFGVGSNITGLDFDPDATLQTTGGDVVIQVGAGGVKSQSAGTVDIVANSLTIVSAAAIGTATRPIETDVTSLETDTSDNGDSQFFAETDGLSDINLNAGVGDITLNSGGPIADDANDGTDIAATGATITLQSGTFGAAAGADAIDTDVVSLSVDTSAGNGNQFIVETDGLIDLSLNAGIGDVVFNAGGTIEDQSTDGTDVVGTNATITLASGDFGTAVSGGEVDTEVTQLTVDTSAGNGTQRIVEVDGLSDLNLNAGTGDVHLASGGTIEDDSNDGTDITASNAFVTQAAGAFGSAAKPIDTDVDGLTVNTSATNGSQFIMEDDDLQSLALDAGTGNVVLTAGDAIEDGDGSTDITAGGAALTATGGIGSVAALNTQVTLLAASNSGSGDVNVSNSTGALLTVGTVGTLSGVTNTAGAITVSNASPLTIDSSITASGNLTLTANDSPATGDDLFVSTGVTIQSTGASVTLQGGDDVMIESGSVIDAASRVTIAGDFGNADAFLGSFVEILGTINSVTQARVVGEADDDDITLNPAAGSSGAIQINGQAGDDDYVIQLGNLGGTVDVADGAGEGTDTLAIDGTAGNDIMAVTGVSVAAGGKTVTYSADLETLGVKGADGDDQVTVTAFGGTPTLTVSGDNHSAGDTLTVDAQQRTASDSGTAITVTGLQTFSHSTFETVSILNTPPNIGNQTLNVDENTASGTVFGTVVASDPDDGTNLTWRITAGNTGNAFAINAANGQLRVNGPLDHETASSFNLTVEVEDSDRLTASATITVNVNDVNDNPVITSSATASIDENTNNALTVTATDEDLPAQGISFGFGGGADQNFFSINAMSGALSFATAPDFDAPSDSNGDNVYDVIVRAMDTVGGFTDQTVAVTVNDVDEAPILPPIANQFVDEDLQLSFQVPAMDPEGGGLTFSLVPTPLGGGGMVMSSLISIPPNPLASITPGGLFTVIGMPLAAGLSFPITVEAEDDGDLTSTTTFNVTINDVTLDYGDAPETFGTRFEENGARHLVTSLFLGDIIDDELDGVPSANARADDLNASLTGIGTPGDDEDGVTFLTALFQGSTRQARVIASEDGFLDGWIDFNRNGTFEPGEHVFGGASESVVAGFNNVEFDIPANAMLGPTFARFRLSSDGTLPPTGRANDGEVEDYAIQIDPPPPVPQPGFEESLSIAVDEFFNEFPDELNEPDPTATGDELPLQIQADNGATVERVDGDVDGMMTSERLRDVVDAINDAVDALTDRRPDENILVFVIHPVDFRLRDPRGRTVGFTRERGFENQVGPDAQYSGNGVVELLVIRNALPGTYNLQLVGIGGIFRGGASLVTPRGTPRVTFEGSLAVGDQVQLALTYNEPVIPPLQRPGRGASFARVADRLRGIAQQDPSVVGQAAAEAVAELNRLRADGEQFSHDKAVINTFEDLLARIGQERDRIIDLLRKSLDDSLPPELKLDPTQKEDPDEEMQQLLELLQQALGQQIGPINETGDVEATIRRLLKLLEERQQNSLPEDQPDTGSNEPVNPDTSDAPAGNETEGRAKDQASHLDDSKSPGGRVRFDLSPTEDFHVLRRSVDEALRVVLNDEGNRDRADGDAAPRDE